MICFLIVTFIYKVFLCFIVHYMRGRICMNFSMLVSPIRTLRVSVICSTLSCKRGEGAPGCIPPVIFTNSYRRLDHARCTGFPVDRGGDLLDGRQLERVDDAKNLAEVPALNNKKSLAGHLMVQSLNIPLVIYPISPIIPPLSLPIIT
jgi:hypothetical protein